MTTDVDIIRTVFEAQFTGRNVIRDVVRELGIARDAADSFSNALGMGKASADFASNVRSSSMAISSLHQIINKNVLQSYGTQVSEMAKAVQSGATSFDSAAGFIERYGHELANTAGITEELKAQLLGIEPAATGLSAAWAGLSKNMQMAVVAGAGLTAGLVAVGVALYKLYPIAQEGAGLAQLTMSFESLNRNILKTPNLIDDMGDAAKGTITDVAAMEGFLTLVAGATESASQKFAQAAPRLMEIAKAANKLNPTLGDTNYMFNSLARGIKRSETRLLDNLGLNIKVASANIEYAKSIGKTVVQLTAEDKQMALLNETLRVGAELINQVGGNTDSLTDRFQRMTVAWQNFTNAFKIGIAAAFPEGEGPTDWLEKTTERMNLISDLKFGMQQGVDVGFDWWKAGSYTIDQLKKFNRELEKETARREEINARWLKSEQGKKDRRREEGMKDPYLQSLQRMGAEFDNPAEIEQKRLEFMRREAKRYMEQLGGSYVDPEIGQKRRAADAQMKRDQQLRHAAMMAAEREYWSEIGDLQGKAAKFNADAIANYYQRVADAGNLMRSVTGDTGLFTSSIEDIGAAWVTVGGRTEEQNADLEDLQKAYENVNDDLRDYRIGVKGYGEDAEKTAKKLGEWAGEAEFLKGKIDELNGVVGEARQVNISAVFDMDKVAEYMRKQAEAAGIGATAWAALNVVQGEWGDDQAEAAFKAAAAANIINTAIEKIRLNPDISLEQMQGVWQAVQTQLDDLDNVDFSVILHPTVSIAPLFKDVMKEQGVGSMAYLPREERDALAQSFFNKVSMSEAAGVAGAAARDAVLAQITPGVGDMPSSIDMPVTIVGLDAADAQIAAWAAQERNVLINIVPIAPGSGRADSRMLAPYPGAYSGRAAGGPVAGNSPYIVGERGPELFVPKSNGDIIPNDQLGGQTNEFNLTVYGSIGEEAIIAKIDELFRRKMAARVAG